MLVAKLDKAIKTNELRIQLEEALRPNYTMLYFLYQDYAFLGQDTNNIKLRLGEFTDIIDSTMPHIKRRESDSIFIQGQWLPKEVAFEHSMDTKKQIGLFRFQFVECMLRLGVLSSGGSWNNAADATWNVCDELRQLGNRVQEEIEAKRDELFLREM